MSVSDIKAPYSVTESRITGITSWYALRVRSRFEQVTSAALRSKGIEEFVPLVTSRRRWSDRTKELDMPLFLMGTG